MKTDLAAKQDKITIWLTQKETRNARQSLVCSPPGIAVLPQAHKTKAIITE